MSRRTIVAVLLVLASGVAWGFVEPPMYITPARPGWSTYEAGKDRWSVQFPNSWYVQRVSDVHQGHPYTLEVQAILISSVHRHLTRQDLGPNSWSPYVDTRGLPATGVAVQIGWSYGGGFGVFCKRDTPLPLSLVEAERQTTQDGAGRTLQLQLRMNFVAHGEPYYKVNAWIGYQASKKDLAILDRIVGSISFDHAQLQPHFGASDCGA
jgi:hypothetical protein